MISLQNYFNKCRFLNLSDSKGHRLFNADDFGLNHETNLAVIELLKANRIQRTTLMVNMPFAEEAVQMAKDAGITEKVGLHLNMTDGKPLSSEIQKTRFCKDGQFDVYQMEHGTRLHLTSNERKGIESETWAQMNKYKELLGCYPKHVDGHRHFHNYLCVLFVIMKVAKKCGVESMRIGINLYDRNEASFVKKAYKFVLNSIIKMKFEHTDYMGEWYEYVDYYKGGPNKTVEIMVHPMYIDNRIVDVIYRDNQAAEFNDFDNIN